jgi:hypothetical protein
MAYAHAFGNGGGIGAFKFHAYALLAAQHHKSRAC